jgi:hypothetical protein
MGVDAREPDHEPHAGTSASAQSESGFLPSRDGFRFRNTFANQPVLRLGALKIGRAGNGLCGGMVFAARDFFESGVPVPVDDVPPPAGSSLFCFIVLRLFAAFNGPVGIGRYWRWMLRTDEDVLERTRATSWPRVRAAIDHGHPCPIGVVTVQGPNPAQLRHNHVVLACGYDADGTAVTLRVYDPNTGPSDDVVIHSDSAIGSTIDVRHSIRGYFPLRYRAWRPPAGATNGR